MIFGEVLRAARQRNPDKLAFVCGDRKFSYAELDDITDRLAGGLYAAGVRTDDRVALFTPNCTELVLSYLACFKLGAMAVPLNHRYRQAEAEYAIGHSGSTTLIVHADKLPDVAHLEFDRLGVSRRYLVGGASKPGWQPFATLVAGHAAPPPAEFDTRQLATIMYTSGTTAKPKGVVHSHQTLWHCVQIQCEGMQYTDDDVHLVTTSACHCAATYGQIFPNLYIGGTIVMLDAPTPADVVRAIVEHGATRCQMLPASLQDLVEYLEAHPTPLPSLRSFFAGGDVVPLDTHDRFRRATGLDVSEVCGMTEAITYTVNPPFGEKRLGSIGKPLGKTQVRIADEHGAELPDGSEGEILIKSPSNMVGYWNDTLHSVATYRDGWLASGDLGRRDAQGYLWFVGRKKEIIIRGGSNISPLEVEEVIDQHPAVHTSGVVGMPDARWGQIVVAYVSLRAEAKPRPTADELRDFVAQRIAAYKVPVHFFLIDKLPLNASNKIDRKKLHERVVADMQAATCTKG